MRAFRLLVNGAMIKVDPKNGESFSLDEIQKAVGGYAEPVYLENGMEMFVDEEGLLKLKQRNPYASRLARQAICGDVLVCEKGMVK